jgi:hypothetical protein
MMEGATTVLPVLGVVKIKIPRKEHCSPHKRHTNVIRERIIESSLHTLVENFNKMEKVMDIPYSTY